MMPGGQSAPWGFPSAAGHSFSGQTCPQTYQQPFPNYQQPAQPPSQQAYAQALYAQQAMQAAQHAQQHHAQPQQMAASPQYMYPHQMQGMQNSVASSYPNMAAHNPYLGQTYNYNAAYMPQTPSQQTTRSRARVDRDARGSRRSQRRYASVETATPRRPREREASQRHAASSSPVHSSRRGAARPSKRSSRRSRTDSAGGMHPFPQTIQRRTPPMRSPYTDARVPFMGDAIRGPPNGLVAMGRRAVASQWPPTSRGTPHYFADTSVQASYLPDRTHHGMQESPNAFAHPDSPPPPPYPGASASRAGLYQDERRNYPSSTHSYENRSHHPHSNGAPPRTAPNRTVVGRSTSDLDPPSSPPPPYPGASVDQSAWSDESEWGRVEAQNRQHQHQQHQQQQQQQQHQQQQQQQQQQQHQQQHQPPPYPPATHHPQYHTTAAPSRTGLTPFVGSPQFATGQTAGMVPYASVGPAGVGFVSAHPIEGGPDRTNGEPAPPPQQISATLPSPRIEYRPPTQVALPEPPAAPGGAPWQGGWCFYSAPSPHPSMQPIQAVWAMPPPTAMQPLAVAREGASVSSGTSFRTIPEEKGREDGDEDGVDDRTTAAMETRSLGKRDAYRRRRREKGSDEGEGRTAPRTFRKQTVDNRARRPRVERYEHHAARSPPPMERREAFHRRDESYRRREGHASDERATMRGRTHGGRRNEFDHGMERGGAGQRRGGGHESEFGTTSAYPRSPPSPRSEYDYVDEEEMPPSRYTRRGPPYSSPAMGPAERGYSPRSCSSPSLLSRRHRISGAEEEDDWGRGRPDLLSKEDYET